MLTFVPVIVTVVLAAVVGALIVVQDQRQTEQVAAADRAAEDFLSDVGMFRGDVARELGKAEASDPATLRAALVEAVAEPPRLDDVPDVGVEQSEKYASARETERTFLEPYERLTRELRRAEIALTFVEAARSALGLRATDYVGFGPLGDSAAVRSRLVPAFVQARDTFAAVRVPRGQSELAGTVRAALQHVIDQATTLAASIDANRSFSFSYAEEFSAALVAVDDYATTVQGDVTEAVNALSDPAQPG